MRYLVFRHHPLGCRCATEIYIIWLKKYVVHCSVTRYTTVLFHKYILCRCFSNYNSWVANRSTNPEPTPKPNINPCGYINYQYFLGFLQVHCKYTFCKCNLLFRVYKLEEMDLEDLSCAIWQLYKINFCFKEPKFHLEFSFERSVDTSCNSMPIIFRWSPSGLTRFKSCYYHSCCTMGWGRAFIS